MNKIILNIYNQNEAIFNTCLKETNSLLLHQVGATFQDVQTWHPVYKMQAPAPI